MISLTARYFTARNILLITGGVLLWLLLLMHVSPTIHAATILPDPADDTSGGEMKMVVSNYNAARNNRLEAPVSVVKLFIPLGQSGWFRIHGGGNCNPGDTLWDGGMFGVDTTFEFYATDGNENQTTLIGGRTNFDTGCGIHDVPLGSSQTSASTIPGHQNYGVIIIRATGHIVNSGNINGFTYQTLIPGSLLSYYAGSGDRFAVIERDGSMNGERHNITFKFAPNCNLTSPVIRQLRWFDDDWGTAYQPTDWYFTVLREYNPEGGLVLEQTILPDRGENVAGSANFTVRPGNKYTWTWYGVSDSNGVQFQLPYDSINFDLNCLNGNLDGAANVSCELVGWAFDFTNASKYLDVHVYYNGAAGAPGATGIAYSAETGTLNGTTGLGPVPSGPGKYQIQHRPDVGAAYPGAGNWHGFRIPVPASFRNSTAFVYAIGVNYNRFVGQVALNCTSPATASCTVTVSSPGTFEVGERFNVTVTVNRTGSANDQPSINYTGSGGATAAGLYFTPGSGLGGMPAVTTNQNYGTVAPRSSGYVTINNVYSDTPNSYTVSAELRLPSGTITCNRTVNIGNKSYLKAYGGEIMTGGVIGGSGACSPGSGRGGIHAWTRDVGGGQYVGASTQLTITSLLRVNEFYSASHGPSTRPKGLTIANRDSTDGNSTYGGGSGLGRCTTDYISETTTAPINELPAWNGTSSIGAGNRQYRLSGNIITGTNIALGTQAAVYRQGDVVIRGNITYASNGTGDWSQHPYFVLIATGDIYITSNVTNLNGLFISQGGTIYTCASHPDGTRVNSNNVYASCQNQLTVNGGLIANDIRYLRMRGTLRDAVANESYSSSNIAEVIRYTPEMYLAPSPLRRPESSSGGGGAGPDSTGKYQAIKSLPPVY